MVALAIIAVGWAWVWFAKTERVVVAGPPLMAVAGVVDAPDDVDAAALNTLITVAVRRIPGLDVVPAPELYAQSGGSTRPADLVEAARAAGAEQVLQASLRPAARGGWELEVQRLDAVTRERAATIRGRGATITEAVDRLSAQLAMSLGLRVPDGSVADEPGAALLGPAAHRPSQ